MILLQVLLGNQKHLKSLDLFTYSKINHYDLETAMKRKSFESLTPIFPNEKISVGKSGKIAMR